MTTLAELVETIHGWYPPATAESWDAVGLVHGDPDVKVRKVLLAVDPTEEVAREAAEWGADLLLTHHPLFLKPVHGFAATTPKGRTLATLVKTGCALLTAHTNADQAATGVSESLALALGLGDLTPIIGLPGEPLDKIVVFAPADAAAPVRAAIADAGAGAMGDYDHCTFSSEGQGRFRPLDGADPTIGEVGEIAVVDEHRIEAVLPRRLRTKVVRAMLANHPYEEPAYDVIELADPGTSSVGTGRIGTIEPTTLADFAQLVAETLPETAHGVRVAGDPERPVTRVAVCGGAGDFLLDEMARSDVDVYLTSDLRHHRAAEFVESGGPALIDVAHWAAESTWLPVVAARLAEELGDTVEPRVSEVRTDPWTFRI
ncbi:Nif3-like dinuclear metal center hexameric protein [Nocardioides sp. AE5]|uniref:Nif3-like dinuclear metal center hexameric protein n=1 Tax=Nocardioides sp. AE5 TaxID=2962573 RepID=UPI002882C37A|nr:Nif3-like dinuclear metal center hexameric protein [Nocardioides sp. AE5]MDT0203336.1 Nif3-like dinuclear metal center hexameric protein [Nocardioides sp. AE5]